MFARTYATTSAAARDGVADSNPDRDPDDAWRHAEAYNAGAQDLQEAVGYDESSPFVAKAFAMRREDGTAFVYTTWAQGVRALLPAADIIQFVSEANPDGERDIFRAAWNDAAELFADEHWTAREDLTPVRILVDTWPTPDQIAAIKARPLER